MYVCCVCVCVCVCTHDQLMNLDLMMIITYHHVVPSSPIIMLFYRHLSSCCSIVTYHHVVPSSPIIMYIAIITFLHTSPLISYHLLHIYCHSQCGLNMYTHSSCFKNTLTTKICPIMYIHNMCTVSRNVLYIRIWLRKPLNGVMFL